MAVYYLDSAATGTADGSSWANAFTLLATAAAAITSSDVLWVAPAHNETASAGKAVVFPATPGLRVLGANDNTTAPPTAVVTTPTALVSSSGNGGFSLQGCAYIYGVRFAKTGSTGGSVSFYIANSTTVESNLTFDNCTLEYTNTQTGKTLGIFSAAQGVSSQVKVLNSAIVLRNTDHAISLGHGDLLMHNVTVSTTLNHPTWLFQCASSVSGRLRVLNSDLTGLDLTSLVRVVANPMSPISFHGCKLPSTITSVVDGTNWQTDLGGNEITLTDCAIGSTAVPYAFYNALGSLVMDAGLYFTAGAAGVSWKITTNAAVSRATPFTTPWIGWYHSGVSSITPRLEILRDGSTTAYTDAEVWSEWKAKVTAGSVVGTSHIDRQGAFDFFSGVAGTAQANGAGLGSWTGESGAAWSGKVDSGSAFTPAEAGDILARVCVAASSVTVYVNPEPLT